MVRTSALEFHRKFGEFQHQAQREPVEITRHGRREFALMSAAHYDWLTAAERTYSTVDAASVVIEAVERAEMDPEHAGLDHCSSETAAWRFLIPSQASSSDTTLCGRAKLPPGAIRA